MEKEVETTIVGFNIGFRVLVRTPNPKPKFIWTHGLRLTPVHGQGFDCKKFSLTQLALFR